MERPNTVHGLIAKRRYLIAVDADPADIAALDRALGLFGAELDAKARRPMRLPAPHEAAKGEIQRLVLDMIRDCMRRIDT